MSAILTRSRSTALLAALAALLFAASAFAQGKVVDVSDPDDGGMLRLNPGDVIRLRLHSTPGTGYSWQFVQLDKSKLDLVGTPAFVPPPKGIPGAEGHQVFHLQAKGSGTCVVDLEYLRPWEKNAPAARKFKITVTVL